MTSFAYAAMIALIAGQASALSCMRPDPVSAYQQAADAQGVYYVLYGALDFDAIELPKGVENNPRAPAPISAMFHGNGLSPEGFNLRFDQPVTVQPICAGPWCGQVAPHTAAIVFVQALDDHLLLEVGPCGGQVFEQPSQADLDAMVQCANGNCPSVVPQE